MKVYFHSPFSPQNVGEGQNPALLLQFILLELICAKEVLEETPENPFYPFDGFTKVGSFNKVREHASLLPYAFPKHIEEIDRFLLHLNGKSCLLFTDLEPLILSCKKNSSLLSFLLKHKSHVQIGILLQKLLPNGGEKITQRKSPKYKKKDVLAS